MTDIVPSVKIVERSGISEILKFVNNIYIYIYVILMLFRLVQWAHGKINNDYTEDF